MQLLPKTIQECHTLILTQKEQIEDLRLYAGMDIPAERRSANIQLFERLKKHIASRVTFKSESSPSGAAKIMVALYLAPRGRVCEHLMITQLLLGIMPKKTHSCELAENTIKVYVALARASFRLMNLPDPIETSFAHGYCLTASGRAFMEKFHDNI